MTTPSKLDQARLRELAEAATPGPWFQLKNHDSVWTEDGETAIADTGSSKHLPPGREIDNAAFIAAANPNTILALLDALSAERERGDRAVGLLNGVLDTCGARKSYHAFDYTDAVKASEAFLATQKAEGAET